MKDLKIFTNNIEDSAKEQIDLLLEQEAFKDCKVRIMPDVHAGAGCVIGFTGNLGDKVIPNIVGVDIGCGMLCVELGKVDIDFDVLDMIAKHWIPSGRNIHENPKRYFKSIESLFCYEQLRDTNYYLDKSLGTLGGGNHFIEIDADDDGNKYLIIHTGSRNLGKQVCEIYQNKAIKYCSYNKEMQEEKNKTIKELKEQGREREIQQALIEIHKKYEGKTKLPKDLCYLEGKDREDYLHDMAICQMFAAINRELIATIILDGLHLFDEFWFSKFNYFHTIHNYIDFEDNIIRKGAISARKGERVIIPMNMRDGCIIGIGKGNEDWNYSAPHGAGRTMSRNIAKQLISMDEYKDSMKGIYTTSVNEDTLDESPMAYKPMEEILEHIKDTVEVVKIIKPIYNFKAGE